LNLDFIEAQGLEWIEGLITGSGKDLGDENHKLHKCDFVQDYIRRYGQRKVEANAMVIRPEASRALFRDTIRRCLADDAPAQYQAALADHRQRVKEAIDWRMRDEYN